MTRTTFASSPSRRRVWQPLLAVVVGSGATLAWLSLSPQHGSAFSPKDESIRQSGSGTHEESEIEKELRGLKDEVRTLRAHTDRSKGAPQGGDEDLDADAEDSAREDVMLEQELAPRTFEEAEAEAEERYEKYQHRFEDEPVDTEWSPQAVEEIDDNYFAAGFSDLLRDVECRWTMCRVELAPSESSADQLFAAGGYETAGHMRKKPDGTVVFFTGRPGFPFFEVNGQE